MQMISQEDRARKFLHNAKTIHGEKFDYSKVNYVNAHTKIEIICKIHGLFSKTPTSFLVSKKHGCPMCWKLEQKLICSNMKKIQEENQSYNKGISQEEFLTRCSEKFKDKFIYNLENYNGMSGRKIEITCPIHGLFYQTPVVHINLSTFGCQKCAINHVSNTTLFTYAEIIKECKRIHNNIYIYPEINEINYRNRDSKIEIICNSHGLFKKEMRDHIKGSGCNKCMKRRLVETNSLIGVYSEKLFVSNRVLKNEEGSLYYIKINNGEFYKIGITRSFVSARIKGIKRSSYKADSRIFSIELVKDIKLNLYECFKREQSILKENDDFRVYTEWSTEIFNCDVWEKIEHYFL